MVIFRVWRSYQRLLVEHPLKTQGAITGFLLGLGDVLAQQVIEQRGLRGHDIARTTRQTLFGIVYVGPLVITWYKVLERVYRGPGKLVPLYKVVTDQALFAPFLITSFLAFVAAGNKKSLPEIKAQLQVDFLPTLMRGYMIFPAVQVINFYYLPLNYRPIVINIVALFWNTYLSWRANNPTIKAGFYSVLEMSWHSRLLKKRGLRSHDIARTTRQTLFGIVYVGPLVITWYKVLERVYRGPGKLVPLYKVVTDQALFMPFIITSFLAFVAAGNKKSPPEIRSQLRVDFLPTLMRSYMIFPAIQVINFYYLPLTYRPIVINIVALFWNTYLSWKANNPSIEAVHLEAASH